jgi:hypothetical protein
VKKTAGRWSRCEAIGFVLLIGAWIEECVKMNLVRPGLRPSPHDLKPKKSPAVTDRYETRFSDYDAPRMRGIAFGMVMGFRFGCFGAGGED